MEKQITALTFATVAFLTPLAYAQTTSRVVVVDNTSRGFSASTNWLTMTNAASYGGTHRYRLTAPVADPATWVGQLNSSGQYKVYAWWASAVNRSPSAPYIITHAAGTTTVHVNQQVGGGTWMLLGTFNCNTGANTIKLSPWAATGYIVVADAVKWQ